MSEELKVIYLQPKCCVDPEFGRVWCEHDSPEPCPDGKNWTKYTIIPEGFALVPIEPTGAMLKTGWGKTFSDWDGAEEDLIDIYRAMITAYQEGK